MWGFETHGVIPDIVTMAKGIGNGFPLGAVVTTPEVMQALTGVNHLNTYAGNPMAMTAGTERIFYCFENSDNKRQNYE